jgi:hypothetical protein
MYSDFFAFFAVLFGVAFMILVGAMIGHGCASGEPITFFKAQQCMEFCAPNSEMKHFNLMNRCYCNNGAEFRMKD